MGTIHSFWAMFMTVGLNLVCLFLFLVPTWAQDYPNKPITLYCGYAAGATTDLTARALAMGAEKILGVPVMVDNKPGGTSTVCAGLIASKKPDGYNLAAVDTGVVSKSNFLYKISYNAEKDFTYVLQYTRYIGGLCVHGDSPIKSIDEFIAWAKSKPGLMYGTPGMYSQQHLAMEVFNRCKDLKLKHIPYKGGSEAVTAFLGKHTDFLGGSGSHIPYVKQGAFRMLLVYNTSDKRDPIFPDVPVLRELGCEDYPPWGMVIVGPRGLPDPMVKKLSAVFKQVAEGPDFQNLLKQLNLPYDFKDGAQLAKDLPKETEWNRAFFKKIGAMKEG